MSQICPHSKRSRIALVLAHALNLMSCTDESTNGSDPADTVPGDMDSANETSDAETADGSADATEPEDSNSDVVAPDARCRPDGLISAVGVFQASVDGYNLYRIPSIARTADGTLLAFAEGRPSIQDPGSGEIDVVLRRSTDCGLTWDEMVVLAEAGERDAHNPTSMVAQDASGAEVVWLFYNEHPATGADEFDLPAGLDERSARVFAIQSRDAGLTWSEPDELTLAVKDASWRLASAGPGGAIQLRWGNERAPAGRILVPGWFTDADGGGCFVFYSDDHGISWETGGLPARVCNETQLIELTDGSVLLDGRPTGDGGGDPRRRIMRSTDGGESWSEPEDGLAMTPVMSGLARVSAARDGDERDLIVHTGVDPTGRFDLRIWLSEDEGRTWGRETVLLEDFVQYSQPVRLDERTLGILFESVGTSATPDGVVGPGLNIQFARVALDQVP